MSDVQQMMEKRKVCVVVPTYNNGKTIAAVVRRIAVFTEHIIIVIDGCTDDTREQLQQLSDISFETVDSGVSSWCSDCWGTKPTGTEHARRQHLCQPFL